MFIEMDRRAIFAKPHVVRTEDSKNAKWEIVGRAGYDYVKLASDTPISLIFTYCHEIGHLLGDRYSFKSKPFVFFGNPKILSFDEIKATNASLDLNEEERIKLQSLINSRRTVKPSWEQLWVADRLLQVLFRGRVDHRSFTIHRLTKLEMRKDVSDNPGASMTRKGSKLINLNTKDERNAELPSIYTETACLLILENTFNRYGLWQGADNGHFTMTKNSLGHQRAQNIIARAYRGKGWRIPSMKDLED